MGPDAEPAKREGPPAYPCASLPEGAAARLVGLYPQRQEGLWMQRVRVAGGSLSASQWLALARAAESFTPGTPLHLTTRQDLEFHNVSAANVPSLQRALAQEGISCLGTCGDTIRNVTVCPCSGMSSGRPDLGGLAADVLHLLQSEAGAFALPRKFKVSFSACERACAQPWINDLGFVARKVGEAWTFDVIGAGSLGPRPATGVPLVEGLRPCDVLPLTVAALRLFAEHGDRKLRGRARLRHVRERLGDSAFRELLLESFESARKDREWPEPRLAEEETDRTASVKLRFLNGDVSPAAAEAIARLAGDIRLRVRMTNHHEIHVFGADFAAVERRISKEPSLAGAFGARATIVSCPGTRWCSRGIADATALAQRIESELGGELPAGACVAISGCPNGCAHSGVADFGLVGGISTRDGARVETWTLLTGGGMGRSPALAREAATALTTDEVITRLRGRIG